MVRIRTLASKGVTPDPPQEGQESVWDYPRPPALEGTQDRVRVTLGDVIIADTRRALRTLETAHPPSYYVPPDDVSLEHLEPNPGTTRCEWKGEAHHYDVVTPEKRVSAAAWSYPDPHAGFEAMAGYFAFHPEKLHCTLDGERATPQEGTRYGGWITSRVAGPFKGAPHTMHW